jgi:hypothetical protein
LDSHIRQAATYVHKNDEDDEDSYYPDLESETDDKESRTKNLTKKSRKRGGRGGGR